MVEILPATSKTHFHQVRLLFQEYADSLGFSLDFQSFDQELESIAEMYSPPAGFLLMAQEDQRLVGCVALRRFENDICEMKRLYVLPAYRGRQIGRQLVIQIIAEARKLGYKKMFLDTIDFMKEAITLYISLGFRPIEAYRFNPVKGSAFYQLDL